MNARTLALTFAVLSAVTIRPLPSLAQPATAPASRAAAAATEEPETVRLSAGREGEYDAMIADLGLEGDQLQAFRAKDAERLASLRAFVDGDEGKRLVALREEMAAMRRSGRASEIGPIRAQIQPLADRYWAVRNEGRRGLLQTLTEPQLKRVVGAALYARISRGLSRAALSDEQQARVRAVCDEVAGDWFKPSMLEADPYFRELTPLEAPTRDRAIAEVLTAEQRDALRRPATRRARVPAADAAD